jgi:hypothetical protein
MEEPDLKIEVGATVRKKLSGTGGPLMRVVRIDGEFANCVWVDKNRQRARFRLDELVLHERARRVTGR